MNPQNTVFDAKRLIGRKFNDPTVQADIKHWPFKVVDGPDHKPFIEGASDALAALPLLLMVILHAFPTRGKVRLQTNYRERCHSHTPNLTRQIQARHNKPWAQCSVFVPPPASRGLALQSPKLCFLHCCIQKGEVQCQVILPFHTPAVA